MITKIKLPKTWPQINQCEPYAGWAVYDVAPQYRYVLGRRWPEGSGRIAFIGLNPSTATASKDDRTVAKCIRRAMRAGFGSMYMLNLFAWRATKPKDMIAAKSPIGEHSDRWILSTCEADDVQAVVLCWGSFGRVLNRSSAVLELLKPLEHKLHYLDLTKTGEPGHPLYLPDHLELKKWTERPISSASAKRAALSG